jgi:hypothetical protein
VLKGPIAIPQIPKLLKGKSEVVYQALGWLACENKVDYVSAGNNCANDQILRVLFPGNRVTLRKP